MNSFYTRIISIALFALCASCSAQDWWNSPPVDSEQYFYGVGEGYTLSQAQDLALNSIAGKLGTTIASEMSRKTQDFSGISSDNVARTIRSHVNDIELGYYTVLHIADSENGTRILVRLDKQELANNWRQQLEKKKNKIIPLLKQGTVNRLSNYLELKSVTHSASEADRLEARLSGISDHTPGPSLRDALAGLMEQSQIRIGVKGELSQVNEWVEQTLAQQGINVCRSDCPTWIEHVARTERDVLFGQHVSTVTLKFSVKENGRLIQSKNWSQKVSSVSSSRSADRGAIATALSSMKERGLWITLGFENTI
jgi:hypothetical protein